MITTGHDFAPATERDGLCAFLDLQRAAVVHRVSGLSEEAARKTPTTSSLSMLGLLRHLEIWERRWFQIVQAGQVFPGEWPDVPKSEDNAEDFVVEDSDTVERRIASYEAQVAVSREIVAAGDLDTPSAWPGAGDRNLRWVLLHMIEETARHAGHADIIRETLDGARGV